MLGLRTSGWHLAMHGEPDTGIDRMREALLIARLDGDIEGVSVSYNHLGLALDFVGRPADSSALADRGAGLGVDARPPCTHR